MIDSKTEMKSLTEASSIMPSIQNRWFVLLQTEKAITVEGYTHTHTHIHTHTHTHTMTQNLAHSVYLFLKNFKLWNAVPVCENPCKIANQDWEDFE